MGSGALEKSCLLPDKDWATNSKPYRILDEAQRGVRVAISKSPDNILHVLFHRGGAACVMAVGPFEDPGDGTFRFKAEWDPSSTTIRINDFVWHQVDTATGALENGKPIPSANSSV